MSWCKRRVLASSLMFLGLCPRAQAAAPAEITKLPSGLIELNQGWVEHDGDETKWSRPDFDDSGWNPVDLDDQGPAQQGWHWYRRQVNFGPGQRDLHLLLAGGDGTYELFVNGIRVPGPTLRSSLLVSQPIETVFPVDAANGILEIALRTRVPPGYAAWHMPQFTRVTMGSPSAIEYERQAIESQRLSGLAPSILINLLLCVAGTSGLALYKIQRTAREYIFLGSYLLIVGISNALSTLQSCGLLPLSANFLIADPLIYAWVIAQIEFTYSFAGKRVSRIWRIYEMSLILPLALSFLTWIGWFGSDTYVLIEAAATAPVGLLLSVLLFVWYRQRNREAGWLILPSLAPAVSTALFDLGTASITLGWRPFNFLVEPIQIGPITLQLVDVGTLVFLFSIAVVMFFRFSRVSREQARAAAELAAAREIQRHLVPSVLPTLPDYAIETAYFPAREVGGDFYQVLPQTDGSILIVIGDVSGKGLGAGMTGAFAIGALHAIAAVIADPPQLLNRLNREILRGKDSGFITCLCVRLNPNGQMTVSNAGHGPFYKNGEEFTSEGGPPLGLFPELVYSESHFEFNRGDGLTLLSDGVVEATDSKGEMLGAERTKALSTRSAHEIAAAAQQFGQADDITVVKLRHTSLETDIA
ncbi:MAG TPA: PP2C family protein-serine/threonine phosphatase [Candidatus Deferrimicrobiaceae bacterium]|nr:PP2C family protein-serine/threonine phosphatase [Candidatus Deferrimicrobiaceae bacterium]